MNDFIGGLITLVVLLVITGVVLLIGKLRKNKLNIKQKNWWLISHILFVIIYFGGVFGMLLLAVLTKFTSDNDLVFASHVFIKDFDHFLVIPGAFGSMITGIWLAIRTQWGGLTKHYWVFAKWIGNVVAILFGSTYVRIGISNSFSTSTMINGINPLQNPFYLDNRQMLLIGISISIAILAFEVVISYLKPWGKRNRNSRKPLPMN